MAADYVSRIAQRADGFVFGAADLPAVAARMIRKWGPTSADRAALADLPPHSPRFVAVADALLALAAFLADYASIPEAYRGLPRDHFNAIESLCYACHFIVRHPLPGRPTGSSPTPPVAYRVGETIAHVSMLEAARQGDDESAACLNRYIPALLDADTLRRIADDPRNHSEEAKRIRGKLSCVRSTVVGERDYWILNGVDFDKLVAQDGETPGSVGYILRELKDAIIAMQTCAVKLGLYPPGTRPDPASLSLLWGDKYRQFWHFDELTCEFMVSMLTAGRPLYAVPKVNPGVGLKRDDVVRQLESATGDVVRHDVGVADGRPASRYHARVFLGNTNALVQSSPLLRGSASPIPADLLYALPFDGIVGPGTTEFAAPMTFHGGAEAANPDATEEALRAALAALLHGIKGSDATIDRILSSPYPGRVVAFSTVSRPYITTSGPALTYKDDSNSTQNRTEVSLMKHGMAAALAPVYLDARDRGQGDLPDFCEKGSMRMAAGRALLALATPEEARNALHTSSLFACVEALPVSAAAVVAAFPAAFLEVDPDTVEAEQGLQIISAVQRALKKHPRSDADLIATQAAQEEAAKLGLC